MLKTTVTNIILTIIKNNLKYAETETGGEKANKYRNAKKSAFRMSDLAKPVMEQFFTIHIESDEPTHSGWNGFDGDRYIDTNSMQIVTGNEEIYYFLGHGGRNTIVADGFIHDSQGRRVGANIKAT